jgi:thiosulfate/3-mercaptopyruvate sulfurtransferase
MPYAHAEALVSTEWLAAHLADADVSRRRCAQFTAARRDADRGRRPTRTRHIPGAVFFDIDAISDHANPLPHMLPSRGCRVRRGGVEARVSATRQKIVVYDRGIRHRAARLVDAARFGHRNVAHARWRPAEMARRGPARSPPRCRSPPGDLHPRMLDRARVRDKAALLANLDRQPRAGDRCARGRALCRHRARAAAGLRAGHIPGSLNLPYDQLRSEDDRHHAARRRPGEAISRDAGLDRDTPTVIASCGSGVTACVLAFGLHLVGWPHAAVYDGSWSEWGSGRRHAGRDRRQKIVTATKVRRGWPGQAGHDGVFI